MTLTSGASTPEMISNESTSLNSSFEMLDSLDRQSDKIDSYLKHDKESLKEAQQILATLNVLPSSTTLGSHTPSVKLDPQHLDTSRPEKVDEQYNDSKADLTIISSDGVVFKVRSVYLRAASKTLDDLLTSLATSPHITLRLNDEYNERATAVRLFLDFLHSDIPKLKYEGLGIFRRTFPTDGPSSHSSLIFVLGSNLDDVQLCADAIRKAERDIWDNGDGGMDSPQEWYDHPDYHESDLHNDNEQFDGECTLDPTTWVTESFQHIHPKYLTALLRAGRVVYKDGGCWDDAATKFEELMMPFVIESDDDCSE